MQAARWVDGTTAQRFVAIPGNGQITLAPNRETSAAYPEGTVLVKHLSLPQKHAEPLPLETQLLHFEAGSWHPYSYLWNEEGSEALLVESIGKSRTLKVENPTNSEEFIERTWKVNAVNECKLCHNAESGYVLGFVPHQLQRKDQLAQFAAQGTIAPLAATAEANDWKLVDPHDASQSLDDRARSYLHANCSMCHQPGGNAIVSFYLRRDLPFEKLNTNKGTGIGTFGLEDARLIVPGHPERSVLLYRMAKLGYARMPYIGSQRVDSFGVVLIEDWLRSLDSQTEQSTLAESLKTLESKNEAEREVAVNKFTESTGGALALAVQLHREALLPQQTVAIAATAAKTPRSEIRGLFETFLPEAERRATLGPTLSTQPILSLTGDVERGKLIYFSDGARCRNCHEVSDRAASLGPTMQEINKKYPQADDLLRHILQPSLKIDEPLAAWSLATTDGRILSGLLLEQTDEEVVLKTLDKKVVRVKKAEMEELTRSSKSLMPDLLLGDLTPQEAADLVEYLRSLGRGE